MEFEEFEKQWRQEQDGESSIWSDQNLLNKSDTLRHLNAISRIPENFRNMPANEIRELLQRFERTFE